jgi:hypothetical protein
LEGYRSWVATGVHILILFSESWVILGTRVVFKLDQFPELPTSRENYAPTKCRCNIRQTHLPQNCVTDGLVFQVLFSCMANRNRLRGAGRVLCSGKLSLLTCNIQCATFDVMRHGSGGCGKPILHYVVLLSTCNVRRGTFDAMGHGSGGSGKPTYFLCAIRSLVRDARGGSRYRFPVRSTEVW